MHNLEVKVSPVIKGESLGLHWLVCGATTADPLHVQSI